jgi:hypothetical protein
MQNEREREREREIYHSFWNQKETQTEIRSWHSHQCLFNQPKERKGKKKKQEILSIYQSI